MRYGLVVGGDLVHCYNHYPSICWNDAETDDQHKEPAMLDTKIIKMGNELVPYRQLLKL